MVFSLSLACERAATTTPEPATTATGSGAAASSSLDAELVAIARKQGVAQKAKLRVDGSGNLQKQSLYHSDAAAVPEAARALVEKRWPGAKVRGYESERYAEHGRVDEIEVTTAEGAECELAVKQDGSTLYEECRIALDAMPPAVASKVAALFPDGSIHEAETKKGEGVDELTIEVTAGGKEYYLRMRPDGEVLAKLLRIPAVLEVPID